MFYEVYALKSNDEFQMIVRALVKAGQEHQIIFDKNDVENVIEITQSAKLPIVVLIANGNRSWIGNYESLKQHLERRKYVK